MMLHSFLQRCKTFKMFSLALLLFCAAAVQGETVVCDYYEDSECTTAAANYNWPALVNGKDGKWNSSSTLYLDHAEGVADQLTYKFSNIVLSGVEKCVTTKVALDGDALTYKYYLACDTLTATANYEMNGSFHGLEMTEASGDITAVKENYSVQYEGAFETSSVDGKTYMKLTSHTGTYSMDSVTYSLSDQSEEMNEKINENSMTMEEEVCKNVMDELSCIFIEHVNEYTASVSMEEMFTYETA